MPRKSNKSFLKRLLELRLILVVNAVIVILLSVSFGREFVRNYEIERDVRELQEQAQSLEARNLEITKLHRRLQTESFIEREARLKLGLKKPGERVIVVNDNTSDNAEGGAPGQENARAVQDKPSATGDQPLSNAEKWWAYFFDQQKYIQLKYES